MSAMAFYRRLRASGVGEDTAALCAEAFEQEVKIAVAAALEPRRAKDRARKAKAPRISAETTEILESAETLSPSLPPQTPPTRPHTRECVSTPAREAREDVAFAKFWEAYPRKVSKAEARKAFTRAYRKLPPFDEDAILIGGLERAKAGWTDAQFIPHAASWLNGERWTDEPPPPPDAIPRKAPHERPHHDAKSARREEILSAHERGADSAARRWHAEHG